MTSGRRASASQDRASSSAGPSAGPTGAGASAGAGGGADAACEAGCSRVCTSMGMSSSTGPGRPSVAMATARSASMAAMPSSTRNAALATGSTSFTWSSTWWV